MEDLIKVELFQADGGFLWGYLAIKSLQRGLNRYIDVKALKRQLDALHGDLQVLYRRL
jgi:hypothetical protein